ncbi:MAG TPA: hypothetical protein DD435_10460 [Cyanobacteria bacterium UBA8530]|nr:hypothetical protein [Cyanobacteria bacterium UBA8530]
MSAFQAKVGAQQAPRGAKQPEEPLALLQRDPAAYLRMERELSRDFAPSDAAGRDYRITRRA